MGGIQGKDALTAYVAIALLEAGQTDAAGKAIAYLEGRLAASDDPYALAISAYALELADSPRAGEAYDKLMAAAVEDEDGLHWSGGGPGARRPGPHPARRPGKRFPRRQVAGRPAQRLRRLRLHPGHGGGPAGAHAVRRS